MSTEKLKNIDKFFVFVKNKQKISYIDCFIVNIAKIFDFAELFLFFKPI